MTAPADLTPAHVAFVTAAFEREPLPDGRDPWTDGIVAIFTTSGKYVHQVHRPSCPAIADYADNPALMRNHGVHPMRTAGLRAQNSVCARCGTDTLPVGARYWGDTPQALADREAQARTEGLLLSRDRELANAAAHARIVAREEILARYADEVDALTAERTAFFQAQVEQVYADLIPGD